MRHKRIWLQAEEHQGEEITWCQDKIHETDVEYVLAEPKEAREKLEETTGWAMVSEYTNERRWYFQAGDERPSHLWERAKLLVALASQPAEEKRR